MAWFRRMRKTVIFGCVWGVLVTVAVAAEPVASPRITGVRVAGDELVVTVEAPVGVRRITLAGRDRPGLGGWIPQAVCHVDGSGGEIQVVVPRSASSLMLRVTADDAGGLPAAYFAGPSTFEGMPLDAPDYGVLTRWYGLDVVLAEDGVVQPPTADPGGAPREVVESDIWKLHGDRLYFFNQYRGLQVIDMGDPDLPALLGTLELPAAGEQMYVLGDRHVVLLVGSGCGGGVGVQSACLVVDVGDGVPVVVARAPVPGDILESRLVGTALYVASAGYLPGPDASTWTYQTTVVSLDMADPARPVERRRLTPAGHDPVFVATDQWLFAALRSAEDDRSSVIHAINISSPTGMMWVAARLPVDGQVSDQYKMQLRGDVFTVIYETRSGVLHTRLETHRFLGMLGFRPLGAVELAEGEQLFATRFDGDRVYIVTFEQIDPLWVVDLSDPRRPAIVGELEVPGFSTYIHPLGDRLVTVGREDSYVAVSLFGVGDPARPVLLDRVLLGEESWWSSSEATIDEKAFGVLAGEGLILVPFEYVYGGRTVSAVQLVDLLEQGLAERGRIEHGLRARRAAMVGGRVVSVSGRELAVVDVADRDRPVVTATLPLSWAVNRIFGFGDYLVELATGGGGWYGGSEEAVARIVSAADPGDVLAAVSLGDLPVVGSSLRDGRLYLAQAEAAVYPYDFWMPVLAGDGGGEEPVEPTPYPLTVSVYDLSRLPRWELEGLTTADLDRPVSGGLEPVWPRAGVLVWVAREQAYPIWWRATVDAVRVIGPWYGSPECRLVAFDVADPARPAFGSDFVLPAADWGVLRGDVFAAAGLVYTSHSAYQDADGNVSGVWDPTGKEPLSRAYVLDVVDYEDPAGPVLRPPAALPGLVTGMSHRGNLLYAVTSQEADGSSGSWAPALAALAYDGMAAHLVDSRPLPAGWTGWVRVTGDAAVLAHAGSGDVGPGLLALTLDAHGALVESGRTDVPTAVYSWEVVNGLTAAAAGDQVLVYAAAELPAFRQVAAESLRGCLGHDLRHAYGETGVALWVPMGDYGVWTIPVTP